MVNSACPIFAQSRAVRIVRLEKMRAAGIGWGMWKVYGYAKCDSCRRARRFLTERGVIFEELAIRETPPTPGELSGALATFDGNVRRLFNTAGGDYKTLGLSAKLPTMSVDDAIALLAGNGNLVKRPFVVVENGRFFAGFDEASWAAALSPSVVAQ